MSDHKSVVNMQWFLRQLGCRCRGEKWILDAFDSEFFLVFDLSLPEDEEKWGTVDILICDCGHSADDSEHSTRLISNANEQKVLRFLYALGAPRFKSATQNFMYGYPTILRN